MGAGVSIIAAGISYDTVLVEAGEPKKFMLLITQGYKFFFGENSTFIFPQIEKTPTEQVVQPVNVKELTQQYHKLTNPKKKNEFWTSVS